MMNPLVRKRRRILLLFIFGVGAPSLVLGYLAFRGIRNDQALLEKQNREDLRRMAEQATAEAGASISAAEAESRRLLAGRDGHLDEEMVREIRTFKNRTPLVEEVFLLQKNGTIRFPAAELLYMPDGSLGTGGPAEEDDAGKKILLAGQNAEFRQRDYPSATSAYRRTFEQAGSRRTKGLAQSALARVLKKSGRTPEAIEAYKRVLEEFGDVRTSTGVPLGPAAGHELASLLSAAGDREGSLRTHLVVFKSLVEKRWRLEKSPYDFYSRRSIEAFASVLSATPAASRAAVHGDEFRALRSKESEEKAETERLLAFQRSGASEVLRLRFADPLAQPGQGRRAVHDVGGGSFLVSLLDPPSAGAAGDDPRWGLLIDRAALASDVIKASLERIVPRETTGWVLRDGDGRTLISSEDVPSGTMEYSTSFPGRFPDWRLELRRQDPRLFETFLTSGRSVYLIAFLLIGGILVFGLVLTIRAVSQELELSRMKSDFVSTISHEFKSPLTSIRHLAEMLQSGRVPSEERRRKYYDVLVEQSERLTRLTENVLDFARMEEGRKEFKFEPLDPAALLEDIVSSARERLRHEGFDIELRLVRPIPSLKADGAALSQAVENLIDNAVKYSGGSKRVVVGAEARENDVVVSVRDFGLGIRKEEREKIFERFTRGGDELTRTVKGSGLGLTLVKKIAEAHGGSVRLESEPGRGSTFFLRLPAVSPKDGKHGQDPDRRG